METVVKKLEKSMVEVDATYTKEEWKDAQKKALDKLAASVQLDGFRKGHAPKSLVKARVGKQNLLAEAADEILQTAYQPVFADNNVQPIAQPTANVTKMTEDELEIQFTCPVMPEVELKQYKGLKAKKKAVRVTSKEVDERLASYQNEFAELEVKNDGTVEQGDTVNIDYEGFKDGEPFDGGKAENYPLEIGSNTFIPGFEDQLVGMKVGEEKEINVTFPDDYGVEELKGAPVVFKVKVHEIKAKILPEIDDELAKDVNIDGVETIDQLKDHIKDDLRTQKKNESEQQFDEDVFNALIEANPVEVPDALVDQELQNMIQELNNNLAGQGLNLDTYLKFTNSTIDSLKESMKGDAEKRVKFQLIIAEVVKAEKFEATEEEIEKEYKDLAETYSRDVDEIKKIFTGHEDQIKDQIVSRKAVDFVKENVAK